MSGAVSLDFIGRRVDSVQNDVRDLRLRVVSLADRMSGIEVRLGAMEQRFALFESRMATMETRLDRGVFLLERLALAQGISE